MKRSLFDYSYPPELVAQRPLQERADSRMLVLNRQQHMMEHSYFRNIVQQLRPGDLLVANDTKVIAARLLGKNEKGAPIEILLLRPATEENHWYCLGRPGKKLKTGLKIDFGESFSGTVLKKNERGIKIQFHSKHFSKDLEKWGLPPLPPYIRRKSKEDYTEEDRVRYQTVFAREKGSTAAPTAGLHFSEEILAELRSKEIDMAYVTLHVSGDTFLPVQTENLKEHRMHGEAFLISDKACMQINQAKKEKRRVLAVGTTTVRTLESGTVDGTITKQKGITHLFIYPEYTFQIVDGILTNFNQPESTLLAMVSAFAGRELILKAKKEAIEKKYRLFSYGDCMLIL